MVMEFEFYVAFLSKVLLCLQCGIIELIYELFHLTVPEWTTDFTQALVSVGKKIFQSLSLIPQPIPENTTDLTEVCVGKKTGLSLSYFLSNP